MRHFTRYLLISAIIIVQAVALLIVLVQQQGDTEHVLQSHAFEILDNLASNVIDNTNRYLLPAANMADLSHSLLHSNVLDSKDDAALERYFLAQLSSSEHITNIYLGRDDGSFVFVAHQQHGGYRSKIIRTKGRRSVSIIYRDADFREIRRFVDTNDSYDPRKRSWFPAAKKYQNAPVWSAPYIFFSSQRPGITASINVTDKQEQSLGVIGVDIALEGLSEFISTIPIGSHGSTALYTADDDLIASQSLQATGKQRREIPPKVTDEAPEQIRLMLATDPLLPETIAPEAPLPETIVKENEAAYHHYSFAVPASAATHYGIVKAFSIDTSNNSDSATSDSSAPPPHPIWYVAAEAPADDFIGVIRQRYQRGLRNTVVIGVGALLLSTFILLFGINRPLGQLYRNATIDRLTQLNNSVEFLRLAQRARQQVARQGKKVALAVMDLDGFKPVNDHYGHAVGDEVLKIFAQRLKNAVQPHDIVGRLGGDEFALLLYNVTPDDALQVAERIRETVTKEAITSSADVHTIGATVGITPMSGDLSALELMKIADEVMLGGKRMQKNTSYNIAAQDLLEALRPQQTHAASPDSGYPEGAYSEGA